MHHHRRVLFICKKNESYSHSYAHKNSGLYNSTQFIVRGLIAKRVESAIVEVTDNNDIDRVVARYRPDAVVIEALWVVPSKFLTLEKLHPRVKWFVHLHSHIPFLAQEGMAMNWVQIYARLGIRIIANSRPAYEALRVILPPSSLLFLPNVYIPELRKPVHRRKRSPIHVGCLGAVRPLKNQLLQAIAALQFAHERDAYLKFYVNSTRVETGGDPVIKNLRQLFHLQPHADLVEISWKQPSELIEFLHTEIDLGMQVSLSETFNVVTADYVTAGLPIVVSREVGWTSRLSQAREDSVSDIVKKMHRAWGNACLVKKNQKLLTSFSHQAQDLWYAWSQKL